MTREVVIVGLGQIGTVLEGALLDAGYRIVPVRRGDSLDAIARAHPDPSFVAVTVAEADFDPVLASLPDAYVDRALFVQSFTRGTKFAAGRLAVSQ